MYYSTKTYGHEQGLTATFRQWRAQSHCRFMHGYALSFKIKFEADKLDERNWVVDFGSLKSFKELLKKTFDHRTLVAQDDPEFEVFRDLNDKGLIQMVICENTGCEAFAQLAGEVLQIWLKDNGYTPRVRVHSVEVSEHGANSAIWTPN